MNDSVYLRNVMICMLQHHPHAHYVYFHNIGTNNYDSVMYTHTAHNIILYSYGDIIFQILTVQSSEHDTSREGLLGFQETQFTSFE